MENKLNFYAGLRLVGIALEHHSHPLV
jgi:hypothetical protein